MKSKILLTSLVVGTILFTGCQPSDLEPENVTRKMIQMKNKIYLSTQSSFLKEVMQKKDINEDEYKKLKKLWKVAMIAGDYKTARKIAHFEPFVERAKLEKAVNKLVRTDYNKIGLFTYDRGSFIFKKEPNTAILKEVDINLIDTYNKYLNLAKKYKMYSLEEKLQKSYSRIKRNYKIGLNKVYKYLIITNFKDVSFDKVLNLSNKLSKIGEKTEARNLLFNYASSKLKKDINFDISKICNILRNFGSSDLAEQLNNKKKLALRIQRREKIRKLMTQKASVYSVNELSSLINKMKNQYIPNYCLGINKEVRLEKKNAFGHIETMTMPLNFYIKMLKIMNKPEFDADLERAKFYAFCLKNTLKNTDSKYWVMYDEIYYDVMGYLEGMTSVGLLPSRFNINVTNVAGKYFRINTDVGIDYLAKGLISYLRGSKKDVPYKMMLIYAYLYASTKGQLIYETNFFLKCDTRYIGKRFVTNVVKLIANNSSNPKIAILAYKLSKNDVNDLTEWFLSDKKVAKIFEIMKQAYNSNNGCY
jgi:hypothetical protein